MIVKTADQELESKINAEAAARTAQDEVLHQQIVKETSDRQNADNGLQQNITQEAQNRQNADTVYFRTILITRKKLELLKMKSLTIRLRI